MGDFMHGKHRLMLGICSALSALGVVLCIWRMMNWEQTAAVCAAETEGSWISTAVLSTAGLYAATIALLIGTTVLAARWWNHSA